MDNVSFQDALDAAILLHSQTKSAEVKAADGILSAIGSNPALRNSLIGGGIGALGGAAMTLTGDREKNRGKLLRNMSLGGLAGSALGGGTALIPKMFGGGGDGVGTGGDTKPTQITDPQTGKKFSVDPKMLKQHPELAKRVSELTDEGPLYKHLPYSAGKSVWDFWGEEAPLSRGVLPAALGLDVLFNQRVMPMGDVLHRKLGLPSKLSPGAIDPGHGANVKTITEGMRALPKEAPGHPKALYDKLMRPEGRTRLEALSEGKMRNKTTGQLGWIKDQGGNNLFKTNVPDLKGKSVQHGVTAEQWKDLSRRGFQEEANRSGLKGDLITTRSLGGTERVQPSTAFRGPRLRGRLALYGGLPLVESIIRDAASSEDKKESLRDMLRNSGLLKQPTEG